MKRAPASFGLPTRSALWLGYKYQAIEGKINAYPTLIQLLGETLERLQTMYVELAEAQSPLRKEFLEHKFIPEELDRAHEYALDIAKLDVEIRRATGITEVLPSGALNVGTQNVIVLAAKDISEFSHLLRVEFVKQIGTTTAEQSAVDQFGNDNVRIVDDEAESEAEQDDVE
jgi:predicted amino acid racemase